MNKINHYLTTLPVKTTDGKLKWMSIKDYINFAILYKKMPDDCDEKEFNEKMMVLAI